MLDRVKREITDAAAVKVENLLVKNDQARGR